MADNINFSIQIQVQKESKSKSIHGQKRWKLVLLLYKHPKLDNKVKLNKSKAVVFQMENAVKQSALTRSVPVSQV